MACGRAGCIRQLHVVGFEVLRHGVEVRKELEMLFDGQDGSQHG